MWIGKQKINLFGKESVKHGTVHGTYPYNNVMGSVSVPNKLDKH